MTRPDRRIFIVFTDVPTDALSPEYGPYPFVQLTCDLLRVGPDGDILATFRGGGWCIEGDDPSNYYSDVEIYLAEEGE